MHFVHVTFFGVFGVHFKLVAADGSVLALGMSENHFIWVPQDWRLCVVKRNEVRSLYLFSMWARIEVDSFCLLLDHLVVLYTLLLVILVPSLELDKSHDCFERLVFLKDYIQLFLELQVRFSTLAEVVLNVPQYEVIVSETLRKLLLTEDDGDSDHTAILKVKDELVLQ